MTLAISRSGHFLNLIELDVFSQFFDGVDIAQALFLVFKDKLDTPSSETAVLPARHGLVQLDTAVGVALPQ